MTLIFTRKYRWEFDALKIHVTQLYFEDFRTFNDMTDVQ